jgi:hypothetical protein
MKVMGIKYKRDFELNEKSIKQILNDFGYLILNGRMKLDLNKVKGYIGYVPLKRKQNRFTFSHPLGAMLRYKDVYNVMIGNKKITKIKSEYFKLSKEHPKLGIKTDHTMIDISDTFEAKVKKNFKIIAPKSIRVNVIGYTSKSHKNEANIWIKLKDIKKRYSIYKDSDVFRVEFYDRYNRYIKSVLISVVPQT